MERGVLRVTGGAVGRGDLKTPGQRGRAAEQLLVEVVADPADRLRDEQRSFGARTLGSVDGVRDGRVQRRDGRLGGLALALQFQDAVAALLAEILDVRAHGLRDPQAELEQQQHERKFARSLGAGSGDEAPGALL